MYAVMHMYVVRRVASAGNGQGPLENCAYASNLYTACKYICMLRYIDMCGKAGSLGGSAGHGEVLIFQLSIILWEMGD